ncbi:hypothetical protein TSAR_012422 [Trichomalopsis sarcophagae]|uniref:Uncharacterized protein n=1 Tax=Trichomalopsis sarcophagae TaxID=543379 RepID=A0A232ETT3_9HYME|nr:hypothetical protein TSAR_012422 [Trichomalopsis sarcophagae]
MTRSAAVLFILLGCFCLFRVGGIAFLKFADRQSALHRFKSIVMKVQTANKLKEILQKNKINCQTYEMYCSKIIENSPSLKMHPEVYQRSCEKKLRPHVCHEAVDSSNATTTATP